MKTSLQPRAIHPGELLRAGDVLFARSGGLMAALIRYGTRTGARGINHAGVVAVDQEIPGGPIRTIEAVASGVVETERNELTGYVMRLTDDPVMAAAIVDVARSYLGTPYDFVGIARFAVVCLKDRWWGKPIAWMLKRVLPATDDGSRVFCSDHVGQVVQVVFGDLGMGPGYTISPVGLLRRLNGFGQHVLDTDDVAATV